MNNLFFLFSEAFGRYTHLLTPTCMDGEMHMLVGKTAPEGL